MPQQVHSRPSDATPPSGLDKPVNGAAFWNCDDVLEVDAREREILEELRWAHEQETSGAFAVHGGKYLGIVNRRVQAYGGEPERVIEEAARLAGVPLERVALFHVELAD